MKNIVAYICASHLREQALQDAQHSQAPRSLILANATRWCSEHNMLGRFLDLEGPLRIVTASWGAELDSPMPTEAGIVRLRALEKVLRYFADFTRDIEGDHLCLPKVVPGYVKLLETMRAMAANQELGQSASFYAARAAAALEHHLGDLLLAPNPALYAAALHPAHGHLRFINVDVRNAVWRKLTEIDARIQPEEQLGIFSRANQHAARAELLVLVRKQFEEHPEDPSIDLIEYWKTRAGDAVKCLWPLIQRVLCVPASSASAERLFSCLKFLNDSGGHTQISTLANLAAIREVMKRDECSFTDLVEMVDTCEPSAKPMPAK